MPRTLCCVPLCKNRGGHQFPTNYQSQRRRQWVVAIRRDKWAPSKHSVVCGDHFTPSDYTGETIHGAKPLQRRLMQDAVPSQFAWTSTPCPSVLSRRERASKRVLNDVKASVEVPEALNPSEIPEVAAEEEVADQPNATKCANDVKASVGVQDALNPSEIPEVAAEEEVADQPNATKCANDVKASVEVQDALNLSEISEVSAAEEVADQHNATKCAECQTEVLDERKVPVTSHSVQASTIQPFSAENFEHDSAAIHFYTGLEDFSKFKLVLSTLGPAAYHLNYMSGTTETLNVEDQFFMTMIKLRQHKTNFELSVMFSVSETSVYNIFFTWVRFMALQWREVQLWPSRDLVRFYSPSDFRTKFPTTRVILDVTECPVKKPKLPAAQQATFSSCKNRNTVKVVVGVTPGGMVSYVSPAYGGSTSDRHIIERSALPTTCDPGDSLMVDKGFDVQDICAPSDVTINSPTVFTKANRMSGKTVLKDRKIASKRVHIERIIGLGKTYKILVEPMNQSETHLSSDIIFICYMLCNFQKCTVS